MNPISCTNLFFHAECHGKGGCVVATFIRKEGIGIYEGGIRSLGHLFLSQIIDELHPLIHRFVFQSGRAYPNGVPESASGQDVEHRVDARSVILTPGLWS